MYAITGATGNTGSVIAEKLLARGEKVRVIGRDATRLAPLVSKGAEPFVADVTDAAGLAKAFAGATAVYAMVPPNLAAPDARAYQEQVSDSLVAALRQAAVRKAVVLSSFGAEKTEKTGPVLSLHNLEQKLDGIPTLDAVYLRAGYFMENLLPQVGVIQTFGMMGGPLRADLRLPMIATRDIGAVAAELLLKPDFTGKQARELLGQRDVSYAELAPIVSQAIGKPGLMYMQLPPEQLKPAFIQMGMSASMADLILEMSEALNSGYMAPLEPRSERNSTPTSIETFVAEVFAPRFQGKSASA
ncbi:MAG: NmrA family NAD(P)-binding protein [Acidobacteriia bacterium]|nr:NmrA family NAD(P)-binding protein [Terriglobia bacterium]